MTITHLVTHSGGFHADELLSSVILTRLHPDATIVRSRAPEWITPASERIIYDGRAYLAALGIPADHVEALHQSFDTKFVLPIDLMDNGALSPSAAGPLADLTLPSLLETLKPVFDDRAPGADDRGFHAALAIARAIVEAGIAQRASKLRAESMVLDAIAANGTSRVLELPMGMPFRPAIVKAGADHLLFVVHPRDKDWCITGIRKTEDSFEQRADLPAAWAGLSNSDLEAVSGVAGATFCHNGRFIAAAKSREAILQMAEIAVAEALAKS